MTRILVVDRNGPSRQRLCADLAGFDLVEASDLDGCSQRSASGLAAIVANAELFTNALTVLAKQLPVLLVADTPSVAEAVDCMRRGAADYLWRPLDSEALAAAVHRACAPRRAIHKGAPFSLLIGASAPMRGLFEHIAAAAATDALVLIQGESGSGKTLVARALHDASERSAVPLVRVDCAAISAAAVNAEIFGRPTAHEELRPGRGLLHAAHRGTLFLNDVGELPLDVQGNISRFLQTSAGESAAHADTQRPDVRIVAASRHDLEQLAASGRFRRDLLQWLGAVVLHVPPLRDRGDDAVLIAQATLDRTADKLDKPGLSFAAEALDAIRHHPWPGNVRELVNVVERAAVLCAGPTIASELLAIGALRDGLPPAEATATSGSLEDFFVSFVLENQDQFTETELASKLGISRKSLWERRQRLNIPRRRTRTRGPRRDQDAS